jgi:sulfoxide reductase heme-binding subunit YedZ
VKVDSVWRRSPSFLVALVTVLCVGAAFGWAVLESDGWDAREALLLARAIGWCAAGLLLASLFMTPLSRAFSARRRALTEARRALGIAAASLSILHVTLGLAGPLDGAWSAVLTWPHLRAGLGAVVVLAALLVTSFPRLTRALSVRLWKPLHRLVYVAAGLVVLHLFHGPFAPRAKAAVFALLVATAFVARLVPRRSRASDPSTRSTHRP